jgi:hypothetical protein
MKKLPLTSGVFSDNAPFLEDPLGHGFLNGASEQVMLTGQVHLTQDKAWFLG